MSVESEAIAASASDEIGDRIQHAAFKAFMEKGFAGVSMLEIATRARVSKRDLYARFANKHAVLIACIEGRASAMRSGPDLPIPRDRAMLAQVLTSLGAAIVTVVSDPAVVAMFQFAIAEAKRSPEVAQTLNARGRGTARKALTDLFGAARRGGLIGAGDADELADQFLGLLWQGLQVELLLGVTPPPTPPQIRSRAASATAAFLTLHPEPR
jgi:AcrR family transcriptional regulator